MANNGNETYNGWTNRETWAFMLHVNNDPGLYEMFRETVGTFDGECEYTARDAVQALAETLLDPDEYEAEYGGPQSDGLRMMAREVGSLWRINWSEVVESLSE